MHGRGVIFQQERLPANLPCFGPSFVTYEDAQKAVKESFSDLLGKKIDYKGKKMKFEECPADLDFFASYSGKGEEFMFFDNLALDMQLRDVLQREGRKLYSLRDRPVTKRALDDKRKAKPFIKTYQLAMTSVCSGCAPHHPCQSLPNQWR